MAPLKFGGAQGAFTGRPQDSKTTLKESNLNWPRAVRPRPQLGNATRAAFGRPPFTNDCNEKQRGALERNDVQVRLGTWTEICKIRRPLRCRRVRSMPATPNTTNTHKSLFYEILQQPDTTITTDTTGSLTTNTTSSYID